MTHLAITLRVFSCPESERDARRDEQDHAMRLRPLARDAPIPAGGSVNQLTNAKLPIYRVERVPLGTDPFEVIKPRVDAELGYGRLPGPK